MINTNVIAGIGIGLLFSAHWLVGLLLIFISIVCILAEYEEKMKNKPILNSKSKNKQQGEKA